MINSRRAAQRLALIWGFILLGGSSALAQDAPRLMFGGDVGININFFSSRRMLDMNSDLPEFERDFLGRGTGMTVTGALVCSVPVAGRSSVVISAQIEDAHILRHEMITIPCVIYDSAAKRVDTVIARTEQAYDLRLTSLYLGGALQVQYSNVVVAAGPALGTYITNSYHFQSRVISPDACYYDFFAERKRSIVQSSIFGPLNLRLPISLRLGILVPITRSVYFNPALGVNMDLIPISGSGATITSIQPTMGVRFAP